MAPVLAISRRPLFKIFSPGAGSDWSCRFCGLPVSVSMVSATISSLESELSAVLETDYSVNTLQAFMARHSTVLHSKHYLNILGSGHCL